MARGERLTVRVEDAGPPEGGVTGLEPNEVVTPLGTPDTLKVTGELNPKRELIVTDEEADPPRPIVIGGNALREKSWSTKFAIQLLFAFTKTEPVAHSVAFGPLQPLKVEPGLGVAKTVAVWP